GIRASGTAAFPWQPALRQWQARVMLLRRLEGEDWPDVSDEALLAGLEEWAAPWLAGTSRLRQLERFPLAEALASQLDYAAGQRLDTLAPASVPVPSGR